MRKLFQFADAIDGLLIFLGILGGMVHGVVLPIFALLFGTITDQLASSDLFNAIQDRVAYFVYAGIAAGISTYMQTAFFQISAQRQITKIRDAYLKSMLRLEISRNRIKIHNRSKKKKSQTRSWLV